MTDIVIFVDTQLSSACTIDADCGPGLYCFACDGAPSVCIADQATPVSSFAQVYLLTNYISKTLVPIRREYIIYSRLFGNFLKSLPTVENELRKQRLLHEIDQQVGKIFPATHLTGRYVIQNYSLPFNKYSWITTHNAYAIRGELSMLGSVIISPTNQEDSVTSQLNVNAPEHLQLLKIAIV